MTDPEGAGRGGGSRSGVGAGAGISWSRLAQDPIVRFAAVLLAVLGLPFLVPVLSPERLAVYSEDYVDLFVLAFLIVAFVQGYRRNDHPETRRFGLYMATAFFLWLVVRLSYILVPSAPGTLAGDVACDLLYLLFYLAVILAIETQPHREPGWSRTDPTRRIRIGSALVVVLTMLGYFVILPSALNYDVYYSWLPSLYMYVALDVYLLMRFAYVAVSCRSRTYRPIYGMLGAVAMWWVAFDVLECLEYAGFLTLQSGTVLDLAWWLPYPLLIVAARAPVHECRTTPGFAGRGENRRRPLSTLRSIAPQVVFAFLIPGLHLALYGTGLFDPATRAARDLLVLASWCLLGALVLRQQMRLEKSNRGLQDELEAANEQLGQSQRMEAIGRLAGGVAHDFNNLLTAIIGNTQMLLSRAPADEVLRREIEQIDKAGQRAAALTKQLLAFGRRQTLRPTVLDLNHVITEMKEMLRRLIGEDVLLLMRLEPDLGRVKADPGQVEQIVMNLVINARDAMPQGGHLIVATGNVDGHVDSEGLGFSVHGPHVALSVTDTGAGMDDDVREKAFEPFFTTKERGRGTGLGLSTVYGIVKQSGGHITLDSTLDAGTTFTIYLPRLDGAVAEASEPEERTELDRPAPGDETVLLVEDEETVRELTREILELNGYTVIEATNGEHALQVYEDHHGPLGLLLTDVVMPLMGGRELARRMVQREPGLKVLFVSGYADEDGFRDGEFEPGAAFLGKPFSPAVLAKKVKEVLGRQ